MMPTTADRWCCRTVELAARMLPAEHRQRYASEFIAELYGMSHPKQVRHSVQVLSRAWALRAALDAAALAPIQEKGRHRTRDGCFVTLVGTYGRSIAIPTSAGKTPCSSCAAGAVGSAKGTRHPRQDRFWAASRPPGSSDLRSGRHPRTSYGERGGFNGSPIAA
jgi:hypothetical protein